MYEISDWFINMIIDQTVLKWRIQNTGAAIFCVLLVWFDLFLNCCRIAEYSKCSHNMTRYFCLFAASRAKLMTQAAVAKMRRTHVNNLYPQPEGTLGEVLSKHGKDLGYDSGFGELQKILLVLKLMWWVRSWNVYLYAFLAFLRA